MTTPEPEVPISKSRMLCIDGLESSLNLGARRPFGSIGLGDILLRQQNSGQFNFGGQQDT